MTHRVRHKETDTALGSSADVPGRDAIPGRGGLLEFLGLTLAAGAFAVFVVRPEVLEALVHTLAASTAGLVH
ncbi:hypothetical protein RKE30_14225 [Streptomyces sp. Li-HN-5-11]|uniref:hypothetical protein n=1 Tax=Streptomyces sp. Li-HN-5-11 TaxID=3075432 RepID=UPI0028AC9F0B|nr:hypothetical protein [Streptomyces sp. Li-HN-5-11]WNM31483.1 hypothetical protein RKE30_14225 [Streptomyces sp. Li-HN-5-11]